MKEPKRRHGLSGTVLIMILTVMTVLIIILMTTLTVVTTANQRIFTKYEENQAYYSARSALDIFTNQIMRDSGYVAYGSTGPRSYTYTKSDGTSDTANIKQGLAMEFEFYKIRAMKEGDSIATADPLAGLASNFQESDSVFDTTYENQNYSTDLTLDHIDYTVKFPKVGNGSNDYGKMIDADPSPSADEAGYSIANIRVEVVERRYNFGGTKAAAFTDMDDSLLNQISTTAAGVHIKVDASGNYVLGTNADPLYTPSDLKDAIKNGKREKDKMRLKVTSTVQFMGVEGTTVVYLDTVEKPKVNSSQAVTSMGGVAGGSGTYVIGGTSNLGKIETNQNTILVGNVYAGGDLGLYNNARAIYFFADTVYTALGDIELGSGVYSNLKFIENGSIIYSTGTVKMADANTFGSTTAGGNIIANTIYFQGTATQTKDYYGNFFCNMLTADRDQATQSPIIHGDIYTNYADTKNYLDPSAINWGADGGPQVDITGYTSAWPKVQVAKGLLLPLSDGSGYDTFEILSSTTLKIPASDPVYGGQILTITNGNITQCDEVKIDFYDAATPDYTYSDGEKKFDLPSGGKLYGTGKTSFEVPTQKKLYSEIFQTSAFVDATPDVGYNGDIDTSLPAYPTFTGSVGPYLSGITVNLWGADYNAPFHPEYMDDIAQGNITEDNCGDFGYNRYGQDWLVDSQFASAALQEALLHDTAYQAALDTYYAAYVRGKEKAGATNDSLNDISTPVTLNSVPAELATVAADVGATQVISSDGYLEAGHQYGSGSQGAVSAPVLIDARNPITLQLGNGSIGNDAFMGYFIVYGDQPVKIYLPDGRDTYNLGNTASGQGFFICTYDIYQDMQAHKIKLGDPSKYPATDPATPSPNVWVYAGDNVKTVNMASADSFMSAHVYIPFAGYDFFTNNGVTFASTKYNNYSIDIGAVGFNIVGSLICGSYLTGNQTGVAYISPDTDNYIPGNPIFNWKANRYARN